VVVSPDPSVIKAIARLVKEASPPVPLEVARITSLKPLGMGDRVCVDTCSNLGLGKGCWWATPRAPCSWCMPSPWRPLCIPRPFRVNAGPVHAYIRVPGNRPSTGRIDRRR